MTEFLSSIIATFVTIPILGYIIVFVISKVLTKQHRKSVWLALDVTTLLLIISVHFLIIAIWEKNLLWLLLLMMILIAIIFVMIHWKMKKEIQFKKVFKGIWRFNFLLFSLIYIILLIYGLITRVSIAVSMA